jgi:hypothetical protein
MTPICPYCDQPSEMVGGWEIYPHRPDLAHKRFYRCLGCDAYVGYHPGTQKPLGGLANAELRAAKSRVHAVFDPLWKNGPMKRGHAYQMLARLMGLKTEECHIGMFDLSQCEKALRVLKK